MTTNSTAAPEGATTLIANPTWRDMRAAFDHTAATLPEEATDAELDGYWGAWRAAMIAKADSGEAGEAIHWKVEQLAEASEDGGFTDALHGEYMTAIMADVQRPMMDFAATWLAAWTKDGGAAIICPDGALQFSYPMYELSPRYVPPADHMDEQFATHFVQSSGQHYHSTMMARLDVLKMHPGGKDAIRSQLERGQ